MHGEEVNSLNKSHLTVSSQDEGQACAEKRKAKMQYHIPKRACACKEVFADKEAEPAPEYMNTAACMQGSFVWCMPEAKPKFLY